jgi:hypothetical protein
MKAVVQHYVGTTKEWNDRNPRLYNAVWGMEITPDGKRLLKIGDGVRNWKQLPYLDEGNFQGIADHLSTIDQTIGNLQAAGLPPGADTSSLTALINWVYRHRKDD